MATPVWLPGVVIGAGALAAVYALTRGSSRAPIVSNALVPTATPVQTPSRDVARVQGFEVLGNIALGTQRLAEQSQAIASQLELGRFRLQEQSAVAGASLEATRAGQQTALEMARIREEGATNRLREQLIDRNYDRELQRRALEQTYALAQQGQIGQGIGQLLSGILAAINRAGSQSGRSGGSASGGTTGGATPRPSSRRFPAIPMPNIGPMTPPFFPSWPAPVFDDPFGGFTGYSQPPTRDLPFFDFPDFDWFGPAPIVPRGEGDLYIPGIDEPRGGTASFSDWGNWWDWGSGSDWWNAPDAAAFFDDAGFWGA